MLIANARYLGGFKFRRQYTSLMNHLQPTLLGIRQSICNKSGVAPEEARVYVWLLPPWYVSGAKRERSWAVALADLAVTIFDHPTMVLAGRCRRREHHSTKRTWALRKGLIGTVIFRGKQADIIRHQDDLGEFLNMTPQEFKARASDEVRRERSLADIQALCSKLGSAVAVALFAPSNPNQIFGAITFDTLVTSRPSRDTLREIARLLSAQSLKVLSEIAEWNRYPHIHLKALAVSPPKEIHDSPTRPDFFKG